MEIFKGTINQLDALINLELELWPHHTREELLEETQKLLHSTNHVFYMIKRERAFIAFIHMSIRNDYAAGTVGSPTGYIEGIYVKPECRRNGVAHNLVEAAELWAKAKDCRQIASDTELSNQSGYSFHIGAGFHEVNRTISFIKDL
ncbi:GNAT family N-acetyltransferase [Sporolactobacillus shoreicorticis]|uniref:Aminoglycoside N(6')-acetyltransferase type 1 n=1 Tax=Sporolactobacillus shoreicorticis TaxID=1923877 RepID=A0ABW5S0F7_9BACL|nr:aminoglycoside 6'-N-acetyltransferase [Sporolactobacillus shoreicorticis]MCO7127219.1 GNAT family N-acetyltransferase [Sporolactobacillus shoreicorticis]